MQTDGVLIEAKAIGHKTFHNSWLWRGLNFSITPGQKIGVIGRNGSGKTTLLRTLIKLIPPHEGTVLLHSNIGYVPQHSQITFPFLVRDVVIMGRAQYVRLFSGLRTRDYKAVDKALECVDITHLGRRPFHELSGGERQMVLIARAIATECRVLILDEPFSGLDLDNQERTLALLDKLAAEMTIGVLFTTHQPDHLFNHTDSCLILQKNKAVISGHSSDILTENLLSQVYGVEIRIVEIDHETKKTRHAFVANSYF